MTKHLLGIYDVLVADSKPDVLAMKLRRIVRLLKDEYEDKYPDIEWLCDVLYAIADVLDADD